MVKFESDKKREGEEETMAGESPKDKNYFPPLYPPLHQHFQDPCLQSSNSRSGCEKVEIFFFWKTTKGNSKEKESFFVNNSGNVI